MYYPMPIILIIVGVVAALGVGGFVFLSKPQEAPTEIITPVMRGEDSTDGEAVKVTPLEPGTVPPSSAETNLGANPTLPITQPKAPTTPASTTSASTYKDGAYTVITSYLAPGRSTHTVTATLKIVNDVVTESHVTYSGDEVQASTQYQSKFSESYETQVLGKKLDMISLSRIGGASLTTGAFNKALAEVKVSARS